MTTRVIVTESDRQSVLLLLGGYKLPCTVSVIHGRKRSLDQNNLAWKWYGEIAEQLGDRTVEDVHRYCKLHIGIPILRADSEEFREVYDRLIRPLGYEAKLEYMGLPLDMAVTRAMTTAQLTRFLDTMTRIFGEQGVMLTQPDDLGRAA